MNKSLLKGSTRVTKRYRTCSQSNMLKFKKVKVAIKLHVPCGYRNLPRITSANADSRSLLKDAAA